MSVAWAIVSFIAGLAAAVGAGAASGVIVGGEAIGKELAAYMGGLYGVLSGLVAVAAGLAALAILQG